MARSAPRFWWQGGASWASRLLAPAGAVYGAITAQRMARPGRSLAIPVVCVGNFVVGGAGKTPVTLDLVRRLIRRAERPAVLSRGYGRDSAAAALLRVEPGRHGAREAGDEPLLLARLAPTYVAADRLAGAAAAIADGATILVLDDGLQNPALAKSLSLAVVDGEAGIGNGACLPAGPLRAPMTSQWRFVSALCVIGPGRAGDTLAEEARRRAIPVLRARLEPEPAAVATLGGRRLLAFTGIGRPEKFFRTIETCGLDLVARRAFPDHHPFGPEDRRLLLADAEAHDADLVTTEKDRVRLPPDFPVLVLPVSLRFDDVAALDSLLDGLSTARRAMTR